MLVCNDDHMQPLAYSIEREFDALIQNMWTAWVDADALQQWYAPLGLNPVPATAVSEPVVGGRWAAAIDATSYGFIAYFWGRYTEVTEPVRLVHTMAYSQDADEFAEGSDDADHHLVIVDMEPRGDRVWVRMAQYGELPEEEAQMAQAGMERYFDSLAAYLSRE